MAEIVFVVDAYHWQYVRTRQYLSVTEQQLQTALDMLDSTLNPLEADAVELRDYIDGRGELAIRVHLAGQQAVIRSLFQRVAYFVAAGKYSAEIADVQIQDEDELERVSFQRVFVRQQGA